MEVEARGTVEVSLPEVAGQVWARTKSASAFIRTFHRSTLYLQRPSGPNVQFLTYDMRDEGHWVLAFSSLNRLGRFAGECDWIALSGHDLLDNLPAETGVMIDIHDDHRLSLPPQPGNHATKGESHHG